MNRHPKNSPRSPLNPLKGVGIAIVVSMFLAVSAVHGRTTYRLSAAAQVGYNSAVVQPLVSSLNDLLRPPTYGAFTLGVMPGAWVRTESGRVTAQLSYQALLEGLFAVAKGTSEQTAFSYSNSLGALARIDLHPRVLWELAITGNQGRLNTFQMGQDPSQLSVQGLNLNAIEFVSGSATWNLVWDATARLKLSQPASLQVFVPYGTQIVTSVDAGAMDQRMSTPTQANYNLEGGLRLDYELARAQLGGEVRVGWFKPQTAVGQLQNGFLIGRALLRSIIDLAARWRLEATFGVFSATQTENFLRGRYLAEVNGELRSLTGTVVTPIGGVGISYLLPRTDASLGLTYQHDGMGEVYLGRLTLSDAVTLRAHFPLPKNLGLAGTVGYRSADAYDGNSFSRTSFMTFGGGGGFGGVDRQVTAGTSFQTVLADIALNWLIRDGLSLFVRYSYTWQKVTSQPDFDTGMGVSLPQTLGLADFDRHHAVIGLSGYYPLE